LYQYSGGMKVYFILMLCYDMKQWVENQLTYCRPFSFAAEEKADGAFYFAANAAEKERENETE
jgi:hypothetical protein